MERKIKDASKIRRLSIWAGVFVIVSFMAISVLPIEKAKELFEFFKHIISTLIIGS